MFHLLSSRGEGKLYKLLTLSLSLDWGDFAHTVVVAHVLDDEILLYTTQHNSKCREWHHQAGRQAGSAMSNPRGQFPCVQAGTFRTNSRPPFNPSSSVLRRIAHFHGKSQPHRSSDSKLPEQNFARARRGSTAGVSSAAEVMWYCFTANARLWRFVVSFGAFLANLRYGE